jgi:Mrp family chromosome partitioning ATPase
MRISTDTLSRQTYDELSSERALVPARHDSTDLVPQAERSAFFESREDSELEAQLRELLNALAQGQAVQRTPQRLVVTGVHAGREASFLAQNLALTCARNGYRVLLVDANFKSPSVHHSFGLANTFGLSNLLSSSDPPHSLPQATPVPNLAALTIGPQVRNWSSLLNREQLFHRIEPLAASFDYMLVDCGNLAPTLVGRVSAGADNVVVAVKEHVSSMRELAAVVELLRGEGVREPAVLMVE